MDDLVKQLHDRATRGETLSPSEQSQLTAWYAAQDNVEHGLLTAQPPQPLIDLQQRIDTTLHDLTTVSQHIQMLAAQNNSLRREIASLQQQLAQAMVSASR